MKKTIRSLLAAAMILTLLLSLAPAAFAASGETVIVLSDSGTTVDGAAVSADSSSAVYSGASIIYYHDGTDSTYGAGSESDMHTAEEAAAQTVITITKAGTYRVSGTLSAGQLAVDLGDDASTDPTAVVTLILDNASITCTVAPAVIFYNVYECGSHDTDGATSAVDTAAAGANVVIADGSVNSITGSHVAKIYKTDTTPKIKYDGAFYSCMSMNITGGTAGTGVLNITADNEGLDSELHLTINGGNINIFSQDDGINTNEDGVSVTTINGGCLHICAGLGTEGDGVDSNGWLVINGGTVIATANPASDSGLDSDQGSYVNGGTVVALGSTMDWAESDSSQVTINLQFSASENQDEAIVVTDTDGKVVFAYDPDQDEVTGTNLRTYQGAVISSSAFKAGETYYVWLGGTVTGTEVSGLYDVSTVTAYTDGVQQAYTGTDVGNFFMGGGQGGGTPPTDGSFTPPTDGSFTPPTDGTAPTMPADGTRPTPPSDGTAPTMPSDGSFTPPADGTAPAMPGQTSGGAAVSSVYFYLTDKVNAFSGIADKSETSTGGGLAGYSDLTADKWYTDAVEYVKSAGLMNGTSATAFEPNSGLTRGMTAAILYRLAGSPAVTGESAYTDVSDDAWYADAIIWATENGIVKGYGGGLFGPNDTISRQDLAVMLYNYAVLKGYDTTQGGMAIREFDDYESISDYALTAMDWAVNAGILEGSEGSVTPLGTATRAQAATILMRVCKNIVK